MKKCSRCQQNRELVCFSKNKAQSDGLSKICRDCKRFFQKRYYHNNKEKYQKTSYRSQDKRRQEAESFVTASKNAPCKDCGGSFHHCQMDFDHLPNKGKKLNVSTMVHNGYSIEMIQREIERCELVCANCHRLRTFNRSH